MMTIKRKYYASFTNRLFLSLLCFSAICFICIYGYLWGLMKSQLYHHLGEKALVQAKEVAIIPEVINAVENNKLQELEHIVRAIYQQSDASFIVIGDKNANRLFHSQKSKINLPMQGNDNLAVLNGESLITLRKGSLGYSLRGKAPIVNQNGQVIGIVSIGYMQDEIDTFHFNQFIPVIIFCLVIMIALFIFSWYFSRSIKKQMFNLEPKEITLLVRQQEAIMESIFEGLIAIDLNYRITIINHAARQLLKIGKHTNGLINQPLFNYVTPIRFFTDPRNIHHDVHDEICYINDTVVIASRVRIMINNNIEGWVISFRDKNDINLLSLQLCQVRQHADNLRAIQHEHLNWMATLSGMLYMQLYDEALCLVQSQTEKNQQLLDDLNKRFTIPSVCGLLLGKYSKAHELGIELIFDPQCQLHSLPYNLDETEFISILGNLLDNAFNAILNANGHSKRIDFYLSDVTDEVVLEVADNGTGIDPIIRDYIFEQGVTSQSQGNHGIGLHLVDTYVKKSNGYIEVGDNMPNGAIFSLFMPKNSL